MHFLNFDFGGGGAHSFQAKNSFVFCQKVPLEKVKHLLVHLQCEVFGTR